MEETSFPLTIKPTFLKYIFSTHLYLFQEKILPSKAKIFISYARADSDFALKLGKDLRSAGANIWIDQLDIGTGERWDRAVQKVLEDCDSFIIILSPAAMDSDNVMDEVAFAFDEKKQILPVLYKTCNIHFRLRRLQHSDFTNNYDDGFKQLVSALNIQPPVEGIRKREAFSPPTMEPAFPTTFEAKRMAEEDKKRLELEMNRIAEAQRLAEADKTRQQKIKKTPSKKPQQKRTTTAAPPAKVSPGPTSPKIKLRSTPIRDLSENAVKKMLKKNGFYDRNLNMDGQGFANQFKLMERQGERLIIDENSGLTWQESGSSSYEWYMRAFEYFEQFNKKEFAGYNDWRLPTLEEAMSLMEPTVNKDRRHIDPIFAQWVYAMWTADEVDLSPWCVEFNVGYCSIVSGDIGQRCYFRAVR